jgi:AmmeMemoRadiSam system protein A
MMPDHFSEEDKQFLLKIARSALVQAVTGEEVDLILTEGLSSCLQQLGASFVTLTRKGELRGCIGAIDAYQPLVEDVWEHTIAAARRDYRFSPITPQELTEIRIEISCLTPPRLLDYSDSTELLKKLRPCIDGVIMKDGTRRATFLPQVWEKCPDPVLFLDLLCQKMGAPPDLWRTKKVEVWVYQVTKIKMEDER